MKKSLIILLFLPIMATSQTFQGTAKISLTKGLAVTEKATLDFGEVVVNGEGTITLSSSGQQTITGNLQQKGLTSAGVFGISGAPSCSFVVSLPTTATLYNNQATLYITEFTSNLVNGIGKLDLNGIFNMSLGGKLSVPVNYVCGNYTGTFNLVINYN